MILNLYNTIIYYKHHVLCDICVCMYVCMYVNYVCKVCNNLNNKIADNTTIIGMHAWTERVKDTSYPNFNIAL